MPLITTPRQLDQRAQFYHQFGQLTGAGVNIISALEMLARNPPARSFQAPLKEMLARLAQGATVTEAMRQPALWMPSLDLALIEAGEHSGRLDVVFQLLASYYTERALMLRRLIADLLYPVFLLHFAVFILPFAAFFSSGNLTLYLTKTVGVLIPIYVLAFALIYATQGRRGAQWRALLERILNPVPVLGSARRALALSRLAIALESLLNAGVSIVQAWEMAAAASGSPALLHAVEEWRPRVLAGQTPAEAVKQCRLFPDVFANLYHSGEISGQLVDSLRHLYNYYREEGSRKMHLLAQWLPKAVYLIIALCIAYKIVSFYSGYYSGGDNEELQKLLKEKTP